MVLCITPRKEEKNEWNSWYFQWSWINKKESKKGVHLLILQLNLDWSIFNFHRSMSFFRIDLLIFLLLFIWLFMEEQKELHEKSHRCHKKYTCYTKLKYTIGVSEWVFAHFWDTHTHIHTKWKKNGGIKATNTRA